MIVEDEALVALTMEEVLEDAGHTIVGVADRPDAALALARLHAPELAVVDVRLAAGGDGIALAAALLAEAAAMRILFATGNCGEVRQRAQVGHGCLSKPFQAAWLLAALVAIAAGAPADIPGYFALPIGRATP